jgi:hypothetical protein
LQRFIFFKVFNKRQILKQIIMITKIRLRMLGLITLLFVVSIKSYSQKQERDLAEFYKISFAIGGYLEIIQGQNQSVVLEGDQSEMENVITSVDNGRLRIYSKNYLGQMHDLKVYITVKELSDITVAGSGDVVMNSSLKTEDLNLEISGSGNIRVSDLNANKVELQVTGSGNILVKGISKERIDVNVTGSGDVKASELQTKDADINITGSGSVEIFATENLTNNIVGSGNLYYKGHPKINSHVTGSGRTREL